MIQLGVHAAAMLVAFKVSLFFSFKIPPPSLQPDPSLPVPQGVPSPPVLF